MNTKLKQSIVLLLTLSMVFSMSGCNKVNKLEDEPKTETVEPVAPTGETIKMITWSNSGTVDALKVINDKFLTETGIAVELSEVPSEEYDDYLKKCIEEGSTDIFCYTVDSKAFAQPVVDWAPSELLTWESIIADGNALDISGYDFIYNWNTGAEACRYNDGIYGIASGMTIMNGIFYNRTLFEDNGWNEPRTWDEFVSLCENIRAIGLEPMTAGGADRWPVQMLTNAIVDSAEGGNVSKLSEDLWKGDRKYTDEKSMKIYERELQALSFMEPDYLSVSYEDAPKRFVEGRVAMLYDGSWNAAEIEKADSEFEYGYFAIPGDLRHNFTGKYDLTFGVNAKSDHKEASVKWLEYFSNPDIYTIYIDSNGFVPTMSWISTSNEFLIMIDDKLSDANRTFECYNRVPTNVGDYGTFDLINFSVAGGVFDTPEEFAEEAQKEWDEALSELLK